MSVSSKKITLSFWLFILTSFCLLFICSTTTALSAPSFSCQGQLSQNERLICARPELGQLDQKISDVFLELTSLLNRAAADLVRLDQRQWINARQACGTHYGCTQHLMHSKLKDLSGELAQQKYYRNQPSRPYRGNTTRRPEEGCLGGQWRGSQCFCPRGTVFDAGQCRGEDHGGVNCAAFGQAYHHGRCVNRCPVGFLNIRGYCEALRN